MQERPAMGGLDIQFPIQLDMKTALLQLLVKH